MDKAIFNAWQRIEPEKLRTDRPDAAKQTNGFSDILHQAVTNVEKLQQDADQAVRNAQTGHSNSLHEAMIALEKADISMRTMLQVRNKLIEAYQEVMRIQV